MFPSVPERATAAALVVGVTFAGSTPPAPLSAFESVFFGAGPLSVASYLKWASYGQFLLRGTVVGGRAAGQTGDWLAVPHSLAFYARGNSGMGNPKTPKATSGGDLLEQAVVRMLDAAGFNWRPYEDAAGNVPYLILLVDSPDAALTGYGDDLWSYEESGSNTPIVEHGAKIAIVGNYDMDAALADGPTQRNGVGTFDHEFSHILGALDMYDTNGDIAGLANWSLMGSGNYNGPLDDGQSPSDLDAFTRLQFGWARPVMVSGPPVLYSLAPAEISPDVLDYPIPGTDQYYLIENRQPVGTDKALPARGLLIYRVDGAIMSPSSRAWVSDCLECVTGSLGNAHPGIEIMQSDGTQSLVRPNSAGEPGSVGDPFPGQTDNTTFSDATRPSADGWGGVPSYLQVSGITQESDEDMLFAAGSTAAALAPTAVGAAGGAVTVTDPLGPFARGATLTLAGVPAAAVLATTIDSSTRATFALSTGTPPGLYLVEAVGARGAKTPLAYLAVTAASAAAAPASLSLSALRSAATGHVDVTVKVLDRQGHVLSGYFGPIWVDGRPAPTYDGTAHALLSLPTGQKDLTAALYRLPSVVGEAPVPAAPAALRATGHGASRAR